jgi:hypothetical protein
MGDIYQEYLYLWSDLLAKVLMSGMNLEEIFHKFRDLIIGTKVQEIASDCYFSVLHRFGLR